MPAGIENPIAKSALETAQSAKLAHAEANKAFTVAHKSMHAANELSNNAFRVLDDAEFAAKPTTKLDETIFASAATNAVTVAQAAAATAYDTFLAAEKALEASNAARLRAVAANDQLSAAAELANSDTAREILAVIQAVEASDLARFLSRLQSNKTLLTDEHVQLKRKIKAVTAAAARKKASAVPSTPATVPTSPLSRLWNYVTSIPREVAKDYGGWFGQWSFLTGGMYALWNTAGKRWMQSTALRPIVLAVLALAAPAAFVSAEIIAYFVTRPEFIEFALMAGLLLNKSIGGGAYKKGKDDAKDWWRTALGGVPKEAPALEWNAQSIRNRIVYALKSMTIDVGGLIGGLSKIVRNVFILQAGIGFVSAMVFGFPAVSVAATLMNYAIGSVGFALAYVTGKELTDVLGSWGEQFGRHRVDDLFNTGNLVAGKANDAASAVAAYAYNHTPSTPVGRFVERRAEGARATAYYAADCVNSAAIYAENSAANGMTYMRDSVVGGATRMANTMTYAAQIAATGTRASRMAGMIHYKYNN